MVAPIPDAPFYHEVTRKSIIAFGNLFSGIAIQRFDNAGVLQQTIPCPIAYANKDKMLQKVDSDPKQQNQTKITFPRMSFEVTGYHYDASRNLGKNKVIVCNDPVNPTRKQTYTGAPWNLSISMYIATKGQEDGIQIIENITPYFRPDYVMSVILVPSLNLHHDIPIVLNSVTPDDSSDFGSYENARIVLHTLDFTMKTYMYGPVTNAGLIKTSTVNLPGFAKYQAQGTVPTAPITETWTEFK
jgi:hypothetical protein